MRRVNMRINFKNFYNAIGGMAAADYKSFVMALIAFEKQITESEAEKIYEEFINDDSKTSVLHIDNE